MTDALTSSDYDRGHRDGLAEGIAITRKVEEPLLDDAYEKIDNLNADVEHLESALAEARRERDWARDWVRSMLRDTAVLRCAFCGESYPPGTPESNDDALTAHVKICVKHPMRETERQLAERDVLLLDLEVWLETRAYSAHNSECAVHQDPERPCDCGYAELYARIDARALGKPEPDPREREWLKTQATREDGQPISVGGLVTALEPIDGFDIDGDELVRMRGEAPTRLVDQLGDDSDEPDRRDAVIEQARLALEALLGCLGLQGFAWDQPDCVDARAALAAIDALGKVE